MALLRTRTLPEVEPVVPVLRAEPFDDPAYLFEPKYDGFRGLLYVTPRECYFRSKRGNVMTRFQELAYWVREELAVKEAILDGEIVALDNEGRQDFRGLMAGRGNLHYAAFDALWLKGKDLRGQALWRRRRAPDRIVWAPRRWSRRCSRSRSAAGTCSGRRSGWTSRGSWGSGKLIITLGRRSGSR